MKKLKYKDFSGFSSEEDFVKFVNENNVKQEDILKVTYEPHASHLKLFYFTEE